MKNSKLYLSAVAACLLSFGAVGCSEDPPGNNGTGGNGGGGDACTGDKGADFETAAVTTVGGGMGYWYFYDDSKDNMGLGMWVPAADPAMGPPRVDGGGKCTMGKALRGNWQAGTTAAWGAGIGTDLAESTGTTKTTVDLSMYKGISFYAKAAASVTVMVKFPDKNTDSKAPAMACVDSGAMNVCSQHMKKVTVTTSWAPYTILFKELLQDSGIPNFKSQPTFASDGVTGIQFQVNADWSGGSPPKPVSFDLYLDDLFFLPN